VFLVRPKAIAYGVDLIFSQMFYFFVNARSPRCVGRLAWNFARLSVLGRIL